MQLLIFILAYPILWLISILPFPLFYLFSDFVFFLIFHVFKYRRSVVKNNIALALPHLSEKERATIERKFYRHMCDLFLEMIKSMTMSKKEIKKRFVFTNIELLKEYEKRGKSIIIMCSHYGNWEWMMSMALHLNSKGYAIYSRLGNKYFDQLVRKIRARFDGHLIVTNDTIRVITDNKEKGILAGYGFASDQSPMLQRSFYWDDFMGVEVPVHTGAEMLAKRLDLNMIFIGVKKIKRGYYEATFEELVDHPREHEDYVISSMFLRKAEKQIYEAPEYYLWTHKRWKHAGKKHEVVRELVEKKKTSSDV